MRRTSSVSPCISIMNTTTPAPRSSLAIQIGCRSFISVSRPYLHMVSLITNYPAHCLDILRQQLQCQPNIGIFGSNWIRNGTHTRPFVDFNTAHTCRNWADIQEWARVRQIPEGDQALPDYIAIPTLEVNIHEGVP